MHKRNTEVQLIDHVYDDWDSQASAQHVCDKIVDRGTRVTYQLNNGT